MPIPALSHEYSALRQICFTGYFSRGDYQGDVQTCSAWRQTATSGRYHDPSSYRIMLLTLLRIAHSLQSQRTQITPRTCWGSGSPLWGKTEACTGFDSLQAHSYNLPKDLKSFEFYTDAWHSQKAMVLILRHVVLVTTAGNLSRPTALPPGHYPGTRRSRRGSIQPHDADAERTALAGRPGEALAWLQLMLDACLPACQPRALPPIAFPKAVLAAHLDQHSPSAER